MVVGAAVVTVVVAVLTPGATDNKRRQEILSNERESISHKSMQIRTWSNIRYFKIMSLIPRKFGQIQEKQTDKLNGFKSIVDLSLSLNYLIIRFELSN